MAKHTPGPWRINELQKDCSEGKLSIEAEDEYFIAQVDEGMHQKANALLIAAAPELLDSLQEMVNWFGSYPEFTPSEEYYLKYRESIDKARAAIAKATGQCLKGEE